MAIYDTNILDSILCEVDGLSTTLNKVDSLSGSVDSVSSKLMTLGKKMDSIDVANSTIVRVVNDNNCIEIWMLIATLVMAVGAVFAAIIAYRALLWSKKAYATHINELRMVRLQKSYEEIRDIGFYLWNNGIADYGYKLIVDLSESDKYEDFMKKINDLECEYTERFNKYMLSLNLYTIPSQFEDTIEIESMYDKMSIEIQKIRDVLVYFNSLLTNDDKQNNSDLIECINDDKLKEEFNAYRKKCKNDVSMMRKKILEIYLPVIKNIEEIDTDVSKYYKAVMNYKIKKYKEICTDLELNFEERKVE